MSTPTAKLRKSLLDGNENVEVRPSTIDRNGQGLFAKRTFAAGEQIWSSKRPLVAVLDRAAISKACSNCFGLLDDVTRNWIDENAVFDVKACVQCKLLKFCSKTCQAAAWKRHHSVECKPLAKHMANPVVRQCCESATCRALIQLMAMRKAKAIDDVTWTQVSNLQAHESAQTSSHIGTKLDDQFVKLATMVVSDADISAPTASKLLRILRRNMFTLVSSTFDTIGEAFDPLVSRTNHDCQPNSCIVLDGAHVSLRSIRPITQDAEITISYVDNTVPYADRQKELEQGWSFHCRCSTCALQTSTWRDALPLADKAAAASWIAQAKSLREQCKQSLGSASSAQQIGQLESTEALFRSTKAWPVYRQPRAATLHDLSLLYIEAGQYLEAAKLSAALYCVVDAIQLPEESHPLRTVHGVKLLQLLNSLDMESAADLPFDLSLVMFELARRSLEAAEKSHGRGSMFHKAVWTRFGSEVMHMARSAQNMARRELESTVILEMSKIKIWSVGSEEVQIADQSLNASSSYR